MSARRQRHKTNLQKRKKEDWYMDKEELDKSPNQLTKEKELNGIRIGKRKKGIVIYKLRNKKGEELGLEIRHLLDSKQFILKKGQHIELCEQGYKYLQRWREKGIVNAEGDIRDVAADLIMQGERIVI